MTIADTLLNWLHQDAFPLWAKAGRDAVHGGFWENLGPDGQVVDMSRKRLRSQMRQIYVFSAAHRLGWQGPALDSAAQAVDFVLAHYRNRAGGWIFSCDAVGQALDQRQDFYELAFVIFGMAQYYKESRDKRALDAARQAIQWLNDSLRDRQHGGWFSGRSVDGAINKQMREQNPHMHLFEALITLFRVFPEAVPDWMLQELLWLAETRFVDENGWLREYFEADWQVAAGNKGNLAEPGHLFEWVWILQQAAGLMEPARCQKLATRLYKAAMKAPAGPMGQVPDQVHLPDVTAAPAPSYRLWPQTEAVKAHLAMARFGDSTAKLRADLAMQTLLDQYVLPGQPAGCWIEQLDEHGNMHRPDSPATSFYHIMVAAEEYLRLYG